MKLIPNTIVGKTTKNVLYISIFLTILFPLISWFLHSDLSNNERAGAVAFDFGEKIIVGIILFVMATITIWIYKLLKKEKFSYKFPIQLYNLYLLLNIILTTIKVVSPLLNQEDVWSVETEQQIKSEIIKTPIMSIFEKEDADKLIKCVISKLKVKYPNGLKNITEKEIYESSLEFGRECGKEVKTGPIKWNDASVTFLRSEVMKYLINEVPDSVIRFKIAECYVEKAKRKYPNNFPENGWKEDDAKMLVDCILIYK